MFFKFIFVGPCLFLTVPNLIHNLTDLTVIKRLAGLSRMLVDGFLPG